MRENAVLPIDIGGSKLMVGFVDYTGKIISKTKCLLSPVITGDELIETIFDQIQQLKRQQDDGLNVTAG